MHRQVESKAEAGLAFLKGNGIMSNYSENVTKMTDSGPLAGLIGVWEGTAGTDTSQGPWAPPPHRRQPPQAQILRFGQAGLILMDV